MNDNVQKNRSIDIEYLFKNIWRKKNIIILIAIAVTIFSFLYSSFIIVPKFKSTGKVYISNQKVQENSITVQDVQLSNYLIKDYKEIILSGNILDKVVKNLDNKIDTKSLKKSLDITSPKDTRILEISFINDKPEFCEKVVKAVLDVTVNEVKEINKTSEASILENPKVENKPFSPNILKNTVLAFILSVFIMIIILSAKEIVDDRIKMGNDVEKKLNTTLLGIIPKE